MHLIDPPRDEFPKTQEGMRVDQGGVGVVQGGRGGGPVSQEVLFCPDPESLIGGSDPGGGLWEGCLSDEGR